ncbi:MAG: hypothetical protein U0792_05435 [Gemmataceae bacterium]
MTAPPLLRRTLSPGGPAARRELAALLNSVWASEAIRPGKFLLLASPDLVDGPALDNRSGGFSGVEPGWGERLVRVSDMLLRSLAHGGEVWGLHRRRDATNLFLARIRERAAEAGLMARLRTAELDALPAAGLYGDGFALGGEVAFTETGLDFAGASVVFELNPGAERLAKLRAAFEGSA